MVHRLIIINVLPEPVATLVCDLRDELASITGSTAAQAYPPHLTLRTGALVPEDRIDAYLEGFARLTASLAPLRVRSDGLHYDSYVADGERRHFAGFRVGATPGLVALHRELLAYDAYRKSDQRRYEPHVTLAFHDLGAHGLTAIRAILRGRAIQPFEWTCDAVSLYHEEAGRWTELATLPLAR